MNCETTTADSQSRQRMIESIVAQYGTPLFLFEWQPVARQLDEIGRAMAGLPVRHLFSFKTCPVPGLIRSWRARGHGIEVVSEFELLGALELGFPSPQIVVNGVGKSTWLNKHAIPGLHVNFDSILEVESLAAMAAAHDWSVGLRLHPEVQTDPDAENIPDQFGMGYQDANRALGKLAQVGISPRAVHMHLRSNLTRQRLKKGLEQTSALCSRLGLRAQVLDCGGGLPAPGLLPSKDAEDYLDPSGLAAELRDVLRRDPSVAELWLENGRFQVAGAAVLIGRVLDVKTHGAMRFAICDAGRTNHALVSDWETHRISTVPARAGEARTTTVCGPSCMAFDRLARADLPDGLTRGDLVLWHDAGAYHIPWETRFSHGLAPVVYVDETGRTSLERERESFTSYWHQWVGEHRRAEGEVRPSCEPRRS